jgi:hypothetical protein
LQLYHKNIRVEKQAFNSDDVPANDLSKLRDEGAEEATFIANLENVVEVSQEGSQFRRTWPSLAI